MKYRRNIYLLFAISFLQGMVFYGPIATLYRQAAGVSVLQITVIESISLALCILLELPWGIVADKIGYKATMIFCCVLYFVSKLIFWKANGFGAFLLERVMLSVVIAGLSGCDVSILFLSCDQKNSQRIFGIYNNLCTAGMLVASLTYSIIIRQDYRLAGLLTVFSYGAAAILSFGLIEVRKSDEKRPATLAGAKTLLRALLKDRPLILFLIGVAFLNETHQTITVFLNQLQYTKSGIVPWAIGYIYIGVTIVGLLGVFSDRLTKRFGVRAASVTLYGAAVLSCVVMAFTSNAILSVAGIVLLQLAFSLFWPLQTELQSRLVTTGDRATALSMNAMIIDGVGVGANIAFGKAADASLPFAMLLGAALCAAGLLLFLLWYRKQKLFLSKD